MHGRKSSALLAHQRLDKLPPPALPGWGGRGGHAAARPVARFPAAEPGSALPPLPRPPPCRQDNCQDRLQCYGVQLYNELDQFLEEERFSGPNSTLYGGPPLPGPCLAQPSALRLEAATAELAVLALTPLPLLHPPVLFFYQPPPPPLPPPTPPPRCAPAGH